MNKDFLLDQLVKANIVQYGDFTLKSGEKSNIYIDCRKLFEKPDILNIVAERICLEISNSSLQYDWIAGVPMGCIPLATIVSNKTNIPLLFIRNSEKAHGTKRRIEGHTKPGQCVLLLEDVITTGNSILEIKNMLEDSNGPNLVVNKMMCIIDRSCSTDIDLNNFNNITKPSQDIISYHSLFSITDILKFSKTDTILGKEKIIWAGDVDTMVELFALLENGIGKQIDVLKLHIDCFRDFSIENLDYLVKLKKKFNLTLWEDRKFADIGSVIKKQIQNSLYCYDLWVDIFTIHSVMGQETVNSLNDLKYNWIVVGEMSTANNLMDKEYVSKSLEIYRSNVKIIGIVTQQFLGNDIIHIVPGISKTKKKDSNGQRYHTMEERSFADFFVVGRSIKEFIV